MQKTPFSVNNGENDTEVVGLGSRTGKERPMKTRTLAAVLTVAAVSGTALAQVPWDQPNGSTTNFDWANGGSANGLFGNPTILPDGSFLFNPTQFVAQVAGGPGADTIADQLFFDIIAKPGFNITGVRITEVGDYAITGDAGVSVGGGLFITNLDFFAFETDTLLSTPGSPITTPTPGSIWTATAGVDLSDKVPAWNNIRIQLDNILSAWTNNANSSAFIEKKVVGSSIRIEIIPAPGAVSLLGLAGLVALRRRR